LTPAAACEQIYRGALAGVLHRDRRQPYVLTTPITLDVTFNPKFSATCAPSSAPTLIRYGSWGTTCRRCPISSMCSITTTRTPRLSRRCRLAHPRAARSRIGMTAARFAPAEAARPCR
jgi:hypothetical protein